MGGALGRLLGFFDGLADGDQVGAVLGLGVGLLVLCEVKYSQLEMTNPCVSNNRHTANV